jgi:sodium-dependent dicarboxylate transporter 2/3/5
MESKTLDIEPLSAGEQLFERGRRRGGLVLAPVAFTVLLAWPMPTLQPEAHRLAAVMGAVVVLWVTEALALPVTALIAACACVLLRVAPAKEVFAPFADPLMFLFIGSFILARGIFLHGLDRRLAYGVLSVRWIGQRPSRILFAFGAVAAFMSAWISNTATTAMMYTIGLAILAFLFDKQRAGGAAIDRRYATGLMLMTSFAASIGGLATPIGTPPNVIGLGFIRSMIGVEFPFFKWLLIGAPIVVCLFLVLYAYLNYLCPAGVKQLEGSRELLIRETARLGPWTTAQKSTVAAFSVTATLWILPGIVALVAGESSAAYKSVNACVPEAVAALIGASLLFLLPGNEGHRAIDWHQAKEIDWGVVLLYGGGFALGVLSTQTGLATAVGKALTTRIPLEDGLVLLAASTLVATLVSEVTSNTASANIVVPVVIMVAKELHVDPLEPALGATLGASLGFMLPVSTPCNAIVYGSGYIPLSRMIRYGVLLDIAGAAVIVLLVRLLLPLVR